MKRILTSYHIAVFVVIFYIITAILAPYIANDKSVLCLTEQFCLQPIIPFSPTTIHLEDGSSLPPLSSVTTSGKNRYHWLGTDKLGRDVASGMIHGATISLLIGFVSVFLSFFTGVLFGMGAAYSVKRSYTFNIFQISIIFLVKIISLFYLIYEFLFSRNFLISTLVIFILAGITISATNYMGNYLKSLKRYPISPDMILMKIIEIRKSFPGLFLILALTGIITVPSVWNIVFIISLLGWTEFARHSRAETMAVLETHYISSVRMLGLGSIRILFRHILPNIMPTLLVLACFSVAGSILIESSLSFLGIGLPVETVSWGKMMSEGRNMKNWWMVVFPGIAIFSIILSLNAIATYWQEKIEKK